MPSPLIYTELLTGPNPKYTIIWLHGLGGCGSDFIPMLSQIDLPIACRFVLPDAPLRSITCNQGHIARAWYDIINFNTLDHYPDVNGITASCADLDRLIQEQACHGFSNERIILAGFSQGGAMTYMMGLTYKKRFAALIALSAYIPDIALLDKHLGIMKHQPTPVFIGHGTLDTIVPIALSQTAYKKVAALGHPCAYHRYLINHTICGQEIIDISNWLKNYLH